MGRLRLKPRLKKQLFLISSWLLPVIVVSGVLFFTHTRIFAETGPSVSQLEAAIQQNNLPVGEATVDGYRQIYYVLNNERFYITEGRINHVAPSRSGSAMVWLEERGDGRHVFKYDILTGQKVRLTFVGTHQSPKIDGNNIIWEAWAGDGWQVMYHNGETTAQLSNNRYSASRSVISGDHIAYAQLVGQGTWRVQEYTISSGQTTQVYEGPGRAAWPEYVDGELKLPTDRLK